MQPTQSSLSVYLHIPFCKHRCSYCDFNTYTSLDDLKPAYAAALAAELAQVAGDTRRPVHTAFFGGGTPSLMLPDQMESIMDALHAHYQVAPSAEISMEANPNTVDQAYLAAVRELGINRLSFGVQSVVEAELRLLDRQHDFATVIRAVDAARAAGFDNFNIDLIYGVPGQTLASWETSLDAVLALRPTHISLYCLTVEPGTPLQRWLNNGSVNAPDPDVAADQFEMAREKMGAAGYDHYEISNWALPGRRCEHNLTYWRNGEYLGLGAGAHGHAAGYRYHIVRQPRVYLRRIAQQGEQYSYPLSTAVAKQQRLTRADHIADTVITRLRLLDEGIETAAFAARFGETPYSAYGTALNQLIEWGLVEDRAGKLLLTASGQFLSNQVFYRLL